MTEKNYPLVSVLIPNYNYGRYLRECFDSLLNQTYPNMEILFSDNKSTDNSYEIAQEYRNKFLEKGVYFRLNQNRSNLGSVRNYENIIVHAEGEFIYNMCSDDVAASPKSIEKCMDVFLKYPNVSMVMAHRREIDMNSNEIPSAPPFYNISCIVDAESQATVYMMAGLGIPSQCIYKNIPLSTSKFPMAGDWFRNFSFAMHGDFAYIAEPLFSYRVHPGGESARAKKNLLGIFEHFLMLNDFVEISRSYGMTKPAARYDEAVKKLGSMCLRYALGLLKEGDGKLALKYLKLASVFKNDIESEELYKNLMKCLESDGIERENLLNTLSATGTAMRTISYDPPEGFVPLQV